mgnify:CR=1 FL=1
MMPTFFDSLASKNSIVSTHLPNINLRNITKQKSIFQLCYPQPVGVFSRLSVRDSTKNTVDWSAIDSQSISGSVSSPRENSTVDYMALLDEKAALFIRDLTICASIDQLSPDEYNQELIALAADKAQYKSYVDVYTCKGEVKAKMAFPNGSELLRKALSLNTYKHKSLAQLQFAVSKNATSLFEIPKDIQSSTFFRKSELPIVTAAHWDLRGKYDSLLSACSKYENAMQRLRAAERSEYQVVVQTVNNNLNRFQQLVLDQRRLKLCQIEAIMAEAVVEPSAYKAELALEANRINEDIVNYRKNPCDGPGQGLEGKGVTESKHDQKLAAEYQTQHPMTLISRRQSFIEEDHLIQLKGESALIINTLENRKLRSTDDVTTKLAVSKRRGRLPSRYSELKDDNAQVRDLKRRYNAAQATIQAITTGRHARKECDRAIDGLIAAAGQVEKAIEIRRERFTANGSSII